MVLPKAGLLLNQLDTSGKKIYSPYWDKPAIDTHNYKFIEALTSVVSALPVSSSATGFSC